jgi:hypothetical protein
VPNEEPAEPVDGDGQWPVTVRVEMAGSSQGEFACWASELAATPGAQAG